MGSHNVTVSCPHCGDSKYEVDDSMAIAGVPDTHVQAAIDDHSNSTSHFMRGGGMDNFPSVRPGKETPTVTGKLTNFDHGKDHNA